jgi:hypothetical protein
MTGKFLLASLVDEHDAFWMNQGGTKPANCAHWHVPATMAFLDLDLNLDGFLKHGKDLVIYFVCSNARVVWAIA